MAFIHEVEDEEAIVNYNLKAFAGNKTLEEKHKGMWTVDPGRNIYLFADKLRDPINTLNLARFPMVCLLPYGSYDESWRQKLHQIQLIIVKFLSGLSKAPQVFSCHNLLDSY
jgi:hypothetical protein